MNVIVIANMMMNMYVMDHTELISYNCFVFSLNDRKWSKLVSGTKRSFYDSIHRLQLMLIVFTSRMIFMNLIVICQMEVVEMWESIVCPMVA